MKHYAVIKNKTEKIPRITPGDFSVAVKPQKKMRKEKYKKI